MAGFNVSDSNSSDILEHLEDPSFDVEEYLQYTERYLNDRFRLHKLLNVPEIFKLCIENDYINVLREATPTAEFLDAVIQDRSLNAWTYDNTQETGETRHYCLVLKNGYIRYSFKLDTDKRVIPTFSPWKKIGYYNQQFSSKEDFIKRLKDIGATQIPLITYEESSIESNEDWNPSVE